MGGERDRREALGGQVPSYHLYGDEPRRERNSEKKTEKGMDENMTHTTAQPIFMISSERAQRLSVCNSSLIMISKTRVTREKGKRRKKKERKKKEEEKKPFINAPFPCYAARSLPREKGIIGGGIVGRVWSW